MLLLTLPSLSLRAKLALLLLLLLCLISHGSSGFSPLALAQRLRISVKLTTPDNLPDMCNPGRPADADTDGEDERL